MDKPITQLAYAGNIEIDNHLQRQTRPSTYFTTKLVLTRDLNIYQLLQRFKLNRQFLYAMMCTKIIIRELQAYPNDLGDAQELGGCMWYHCPSL